MAVKLIGETAPTGPGLRRHVPEIAARWLHEVPERRWQILDGTLCFLDISGFTALAERLAQRGRVGGEELVETLGRVFTDMLAIARRRGGSLVKFGGDALLLFFDDPDHPRQAACAAVEMRRALKRAAGLPTSVGPLRLSMSVGLHSGPVHFFLVGTTHRELVVLGPGADQVLAMESAAGAGEILVSAQTAAALPRQAVRPRADGARLLRWRDAPVAPCGERVRRDVDANLLAGLVPATLAAHLAPGAPDPQHRVACVAFARFSGTDRLLAEAGVEALASALQTTVGTIQQVLAEAGVTLLVIDVDRDGGKFFMASGVPHGHADDEGLMLRALRRIADLDLPLGLQMGVNRGHLFVAEIGDGLSAAFSAMGDTTNTAARIAAKAPVGRIYAHPSTLDHSLTRFEVSAADPLVLKGKQSPLIVYDIGVELGLREREGLEVERFVGRQAELDRLHQAMAALAGGRGGAISIVGDIGIGKTRLLHEAVADVRNIVAGEQTLALRAEPYRAASAYGMLRDPFRALLGLRDQDPQALQAGLAAAVTRLAPELTPWLSLLGDVVHVPMAPSTQVLALEPRFRPERTAAAVLTLLEAIHAGPWLISVDDAHWCDTATATLLEHIARACDLRPWLMLVARRDGDGGFCPEQTGLLTLAPMPDADIEALVRTATEAAPLRPQETDVVVRRAAGYPLFAEEIIRAVREFGSIDAVPESLEAAMAARIDSLDRAARRVVQYASVLGYSFPAAVLAEVLAADGHRLDPEHLTRVGEYLVADGDGTLRFRSGVLRDTVYEGVAYRVRARLHGLAGATIEQRAADPDLVADVLALHFAESNDPVRTWRYARTAAQQARDKFANADAARFFEMALDAGRRAGIEDRSRYVELWRELGYARLDAGFMDGALDAHRRVLKLAGSDPLERAAALHHLAKAKDYTGAFSSALRDLTMGRRLVEPLRDQAAQKLLAEIETLRARVLFSMDRARQATAQAQRAKAVAVRAGDRASLAHSLMVEDMARLQLEGAGEGLGLREAKGIFEELGSVLNQAAVTANLGIVAAIGGRWDEAARCFDGSRALYVRCGNVIDAAVVSKNLGELLLSQGRWREAESVLDEALRVMRACRWAEGIRIVETQLGHVLIERGELERADQLLAKTANECIAGGQPHEALEANLLRVAGRILAGEPAAALELLEQSVRASGGDGGMLAPRVTLLEALALGRLGRIEEALRQCTVGEDAAHTLGLPYEKALIVRIAAQLSRVAGEAARPGETESTALLRDLGVVVTPRSYSWEALPGP